MITLALVLGITSPAIVPPAPRFTRVELTCDAGCVSADSSQIADALRSGLAQYGVTVVVRRTAREDLPLVVIGRITAVDGKLRVAAEIQEAERAIAQYTVLEERATLTAQVRRMGERFGRAVVDR